MEYQPKGKERPQREKIKFLSPRDIFALLFLQEGSCACQESQSTPWIPRKVSVGFDNT